MLNKAKKSMKHLSGQIIGLENSSASDKKKDYEQFRQFYFSSDIAQSRIIIILLAISVATFGISDYLLLGMSPQFYIIEAFRIAVVFYSLFQVMHLSRTSNFRSYDKMLFFYLLIFVAFSLLVNTTRLHEFAVQAVIAGISVFAFYLAIPTRFLNQVLLSSIYTAGETALVLTVANLSAVPEMFTVVFSLFFANTIAAVGSWQVHRFRLRVFQDYIERKKAERYIVIGQTAGMVGHDIRNPLQAITGDVFLIEQELNSRLDCKSKDIVESINSINANISYINKIISDLQDYTRPIEPAVALVNVKDLIDSTLKEANVPEKVQCKILVEEDVQLITDAVYLRRILSNLILNAVQAMPKGGYLTLEAYKKEGKVIISIEDTGLGIPDETKPNLFKPLFTTKAKGQGLGLAVVKRLVEALGGTITFESQIGKGTKFTIELPIG